MIKELVTRHHALTGSNRARWILDNWAETLPQFIKVFPHELKRVLGVPRAEQPYIPGQPVGSAELLEQVQHG
jgi:glutamate synthase domain-containing protein 3